jgi:hypothetical protein
MTLNEKFASALTSTERDVAPRLFVSSNVDWTFLFHKLLRICDVRLNEMAGEIKEKRERERERERE